MQRRPSPDGGPYVPLDLRWPFERVRDVVRSAVEEHGSEWVFIAGGAGAFTNPLMRADQYAEMFDTNVRGPIAAFQGALKIWLREKVPARVLYLGSSCARNRATRIELYAASKAAASKYFIEAGVRYAQKRLRVNVLEAGWFESPMTDAIRHADEERPEAKRVWPRIVRQIPVGRAATPEEIAEVAYSVLAGPDYVTGSTIPITGGL